MSPILAYCFLTHVFDVRHTILLAPSDHWYGSGDFKDCSASYTRMFQCKGEGAVLMSSNMVKPRMRMLVSLLASTYYCPWPSHAFILRIVGLACKEPSKTSIARIGGEVYEQFKAFRLLDGQLAAVPRRKGISCPKNPSERRCGRIRFNERFEGLPACQGNPCPCLGCDLALWGDLWG